MHLDRQKTQNEKLEELEVLCFKFCLRGKGFFRSVCEDFDVNLQRICWTPLCEVLWKVLPVQYQYRKLQLWYSYQLLLIIQNSWIENDPDDSYQLQL